jgi:ABC-type transport system substrate-binding protein
LTFSDGTPLNAMATKDAITRARTRQNSALIKDLEPVSNVTTAGGYDVNVHLNHPESTNTS